MSINLSRDFYWERRASEFLNQKCFFLKINIGYHFNLLRDFEWKKDASARCFKTFLFFKIDIFQKISNIPQVLIWFTKCVSVAILLKEQISNVVMKNKPSAIPKHADKK